MWLSSLLLFLVAGHVSCLSTGAPASACNDMVPQHGVAAQSVPYPGQIVVDKSTFRPGDTVQLLVGNQPFRGIFVQARLANSPSVRVGDWVSVPAGYQTVDCSAAGGGWGVTHSSNVDKQMAMLTWRAPTNLADNTQVVFLVTVVVTQQVFWVQQRSQLLTASSGGVLPTSTAAPAATTRAPPSPALQYVDFTGCGQNTKSCFYYGTSGGCSADCEYKMSITLDAPQPGYLQVDMVGKRSGWLAVAFSEDTSMGDDEVYACADSGVSGVPALRRYWNPGGHQASQLQATNPAQLNFQKAPAYVDGYVQCSFYRPAAPSNSSYPHTRNVATQATNLMFTYGTVDTTTGDLRRHVPGSPARTTSPVSLQTPVSQYLGTTGSGSSTGAIIVSVIAGAALLTLVGLFLWYLFG